MRRSRADGRLVFHEVLTLNPNRFLNSRAAMFEFLRRHSSKRIHIMM
jgi:hypothetical protein